MDRHSKRIEFLKQQQLPLKAFWDPNSGYTSRDHSIRPRMLIEGHIVKITEKNNLRFEYFNAKKGRTDFKHLRAGNAYLEGEV